VCTPQVAKAKSQAKAPDNISSMRIHMRKSLFCGLRVLGPQGPGPPKSNMSFMPFEDNMVTLKLYIFSGSDLFEAFWFACFESTISLTLTDFSFNSQIWEEKKPSVHPSFFQKHGGSLTTRGCSSGQEAPPWTRGIYTSTCISFCSRWANLKTSHRAPSQRPSHGLSKFSVVNQSAVDNRFNGQLNSSHGRTAVRARGTRWSESESELPPLSLQSELSRKTGDLHRPLLWHGKGPGSVPGNIVLSHLNHGTCIYFPQSPILTRARIYSWEICWQQ
jgi:hypothetical protein